jgi:hypothetical protein
MPIVLESPNWNVGHNVLLVDDTIIVMRKLGKKDEKMHT